MKPVYKIVKDNSYEGGYKLVSEVFVNFGKRTAINFVASGTEEKLLSVKAKLEKL